MEEVATVAAGIVAEVTEAVATDSAVTPVLVAAAIRLRIRLVIPLAGSSVVTAGNPKALR